MIPETKLAEMLCTRLCHDLTGPIGAVNNGAEFLEDEGFNMENEAVQLILSSAHEAVSRLQFYRQAYGRINDSGEACLGDKKKLVMDFFASSKVKIDWPDSHTDAAGISISQKTGRLMLNLLVIAGGSLIRGGTVSVRLNAEESFKQVHITATGDTIKIDPELRDILAGEGSEAVLSPKTAQAFLTAKIAQEVGARLMVSVENNQLAIVITQKQVVFATAAH